MIFTKFHQNRLINEQEISEKHALLVSCGLRYSVTMSVTVNIVKLRVINEGDCVTKYLHTYHS